MNVIEIEGVWYAALQVRRGDLVEYRVVLLPRRMKDARTLSFALWGDFAPYVNPIKVAVPVPPEAELARALERPLSIDEAVPTPLAFLDYWRRVCAGETQPGQLEGESEGGDPMAGIEEPKLEPRRRAGARATKYETDEDGRTVCVEVGANP